MPDILPSNSHQQRKNTPNFKNNFTPFVTTAATLAALTAAFFFLSLSFHPLCGSLYYNATETEIEIREVCAT